MTDLTLVLLLVCSFVTVCLSFVNSQTAFVRSQRYSSRSLRQNKLLQECAGGCCLRMTETRRDVLFKSAGLILVGYPMPNYASDDILETEEGLASVTQSNIGKSVRYSTIRGARIFDKVDETWARLSDSLRDEQKCDPVTNRRLFDNGYRRDGTRVGNPVLGALCDPVPMRPLSDDVVRLILKSSFDTALNDLNIANVDKTAVEQAMQEIDVLVRPSFDRAAKDQKPDVDESDKAKRRDLNVALYVQMRAFSELVEKAKVPGSGRKLISTLFESSWGKKINKELAASANRKDFKSPLPPLPADSLPESRPYDADKLLDALGVMSVCLERLQTNGLIGRWEIIIPPDDFGDVVTIAVDDDTTLPVQILLQEQRKTFRGSVVSAIIEAAMDDSQISYNVESFFIDPSTTRQEKYNPTQLLVNLSNLGSS